LCRRIQGDHHGRGRLRRCELAILSLPFGASGRASAQSVTMGPQAAPNPRPQPQNPTGIRADFDYRARVVSAWVVPKKNRSVLVRLAEEHGYRDGAPPLVDIGPLPMPPLAPHVLDVAADTLVYFDRHLRVVRGPGREPVASRSVRLDWSLEIHALLLHDGVVYAGGGSGSEVLGLVDLRGDLRWRSIEVPRDILTFGKGIDGFALRGRTLVAVDDIALPRYFLLYDLSDA